MRRNRSELGPAWKSEKAAPWTRPDGLTPSPAYGEVQHQARDFLSKFDQDQRAEQQKRVDLAQKVRRTGWDEGDLETGQVLAGKEVMTAVPPPVKKLGRSVSAFAQNVKAMNFFSVFVDTKQPPCRESGELATLANHNRDEKMAASLPVERSSPSIDHKDDKTARNAKCQCGSPLTNEMIKEMVLQSPLKDMVDHIHWKLFNDKTTLPNAGLGGAQSAQQPFEPSSSKNAAYPLNQRTDVQVLNMILDQMLSGKFYYGSDKMHDRLAEKSLFKGAGRVL